ncbi:serine protease Do [Tepidamorphus gemmatus]|uniref:Probable periplasmic serine endoprotease DegP-like n=1 Tax=Tepidamorphus gemmatus TaxID=747076 RepID=A0A4R3M5R1_9HYPH|nr:Do family serine endopeptidase [Tepidamorphus gemmatus]TCT08704.1 serine protease Do [Tepidamorphus gemmatus]
MSGHSTPTSVRRLRSALLGGAAALAIVGAAAGTTILNPPVATAKDITARVQSTAPFDFADLVEAVRPAVVSVEIERPATPAAVAGGAPDMPQMPGFDDLPEDHPLRRFFHEFEQRFGENRGDRGGEQHGQPRRGPGMMGQGSGFIISEDGYVVTNNHVTSGAGKITVKSIDGKSYEATLVGSDARTDLALLKIEADGPLPYVSFAKERPRVGQWVVAVGNPFGLGGTVTAGIVSADGRDIGSGPYDDYLQIDAPVNRGNSGGPTFNINGEVIGVNTAIFSPSGGNVGIAFAIPASVAVPVIEQLKEHGMVSRGWLGVQIQPVTEDIADSLGLDTASGAIVASTLDSGPARAAGIKSGDVILSVNGQPVADARDLARKIGNLKPNAKAELGIWRDGDLRTISVDLGAQPGDPQRVAAAPALERDALAKFGLAVAPADDDNGVGVRIVEVDPDSEAARKGLQAGDVIVAAGGAEIDAPSDLAEAVRTAEEKGRKAVLFRVRSGDSERFVALALPKA